jgi:hypothetical protein
MENENQGYTRINNGLGMIIASLLYLSGLSSGIILNSNKFSNKNVQRDFIPLSKIELKCKNLDKSDNQNLPETYLTIHDIDYQLKYGPRGPVLIKNESVK